MHTSVTRKSARHVRSTSIDPMRLLLFALIPLLALNSVLWQVYTHQPFIASCWGGALVLVLFYARRLA